MSSDKTGLALSHQQLLFQQGPNSGFRTNHRVDPGGPADGTTDSNNGKATRELTGFIDHQNRYYEPERGSGFRSSVYISCPGQWHGGNGRGSASPSCGNGLESDCNNVVCDDDDEDDGDVEGLVDISDNKNNIDNSSNSSGHSSDKDVNVKSNHLSSIGSRGEVSKVGNVAPSGNDLNDTRPSTSENHQQEPNQYQNSVALVERGDELYYPEYIHGAQGSGSGSGLKDTGVENGCGFSGRKDVSCSGESRDSLRSILSDPLTGALMDDAMILPCGHSFGSGGLLHVMRMKACYTCSHPVTEGSVASNLSLRSAVSAFRREEELQVHHTSKRRRERLDQDRVNYNNSMFMDTPRGRGLQFPFSVADRVIIKGNKRTPERFFGCEAVVTTKCLNGWYVVKTLDNAESIKVQYRSLAKVSDNSSSRPLPSKMTPNWL